MAATSSPEEMSATQRIQLGTGSDQSSAFELAIRHSRRVRRLKVAFPTVAVLLALGFAAGSYLRSPAPPAVASTESAYADGKLVMARPQLEGVTKDNRPYEMIAQRAIQEVGTPGVIQLEEISAKLPLYLKDWVSIDAPAGTFDRDKNTLEMKSPFRIKTTNGLSATINSAFVDMENNTMNTGDPVDIDLKGSRLTAESMSVLEKGKLFVFDRRVRLVIDPSRLSEMRSAGETGENARADADGGK